jgi:hypothetical protein
MRAEGYSASKSGQAPGPAMMSGWWTIRGGLSPSRLSAISVRNVAAKSAATSEQAESRV